MIAIYSTNRYEYDAVILGGYQANITNVALYDTLGLVFNENFSFHTDKISLMIRLPVDVSWKAQ